MFYCYLNSNQNFLGLIFIDFQYFTWKIDFYFFSKMPSASKSVSKYPVWTLLPRYYCHKYPNQWNTILGDPALQHFPDNQNEIIRSRHKKKKMQEVTWCSLTSNILHSFTLQGLWKHCCRVFDRRNNIETVTEILKIRLKVPKKN